MTQARITVRNVFRANYQVPASSNDNWGSSGSGVTIEGDRERAEIKLVLRYVKRIGLPTGRDDSALGGWAFASHHRFDRGRGVVHQGNGEVRQLPLIGTFRKLGFGGQGRSYDFIGQEVDAATLRLNSLAGIQADPDGSVWIMGDIRPDLTGRTIINVRDGRARISELPLGPRLCVDVVCYREMEQLPDGRLVMLLPHSVHTYDPRTGTTDRVGGTSEVDAPNATPFPDGSRATDVPLHGVTAMAVSPGGEIYVAHKYGSVGAFRLVRIDPLGRIFFVGGTDAADNLGCDEFAQEGDLVRETCFSFIRSLAFDLEGNLLIAGMRQWAPAGYGAIVKVRADGRLTHVAGCTDAGCAPGPLEHRNQQLDFGSSVFGPQSIEGRPDGKILARGVRVGGGAGGMFYAVDPVVGSSAVVAGGVDNTAAARTLGTPATHSFFYGEGSQSYGPLGLALDIPDEGNNLVLAVLDEPAALAQVPSEDGTEVWHFDPAGLHLRTTDAITGRLLREFSYDPEGRLVSFRDADNNVTTIERDGSGVPLAIVAPTGERSTLSLDADGNLVELATPAGRRTTASYLAGGLLERLTDARGGVYNYSYDANARLIGNQGPDGVGATLAFSETNTTRTAVHTTNGNITSTYLTESLDEVGRRLTRTEASGAIASFTIRSTGVPAVVEENAYRTLTSVVAPDPRFGLLAPVLQSLERGPGTPRVLLAESVASTGSPANPDTLVQSITSPYGTETMSHDRAAATMTFGSSSGRSAVLALDAQGRPQTLSYPGLDLQSRSYDAGGRLSTISEGGFVARYGYSPNGHLASITDADGEVYAFERDADGRVNGLVDPSSRRTALGRNGMGDLTSLTLADGTIHTLARSPGGRLSSYVAPGGAATGFGYDADGQHATTTLPSGRTLTLQRDGTNRVTTITTPEATTTLTYADPNQSARVYEQLWTPSTGVAERTVTTFTAERLTRLSHFAGASEVFRMSYGYDSSGRVTQHSLLAPTAGSRAYALEVDDDQLTTLYGPFGREVDFDRSGPLGGAVAITSDRLNQTLRYDGRGALVGRTTLVNGIPLYSYDLTRAANGRITERREVIGAAAPTLSSYGYDAAGRLTSVARDAVTAEAYTYDARDNRTSRTIAAGPAELSSYTADDRQTAPATLNADGQLTSRGADTFTFGARGELLSAAVGGGTATYGYDALNRRVSRRVGASTWRYFYGNPKHDTQLSAMVAPGNDLWSFIYDDFGILIAIDRGSSTRYYVATDQLGSPVVVSDREGLVVQSLSYDAFGRIRTESAPTFDLPIGFAGGLRDETTGFLRFGLRDYDPESGLFATRDPVLFKGDQTNLYAYVNNDPVRWIDPSGTFSTEVGLCSGICIDTKISITSAGISACVGTGVGVGNTLDVSPSGALDETRIAFFKGTAAVSAGPVQVGVEAELENIVCGPNIKKKACIFGGCLTFDDKPIRHENANYDALSHRAVENAVDKLTPPGAGGKKGTQAVKVTASLLAFHCEAVLW